METSLDFIQPEIENKNLLNEIDIYTCPKCSSCIEIESIDDKNANITFKCLNKNENLNHKTQTIPIKQYLNDFGPSFKLPDSVFVSCSALNESSKLSSSSYLSSFSFL